MIDLTELDEFSWQLGKKRPPKEVMTGIEAAAQEAAIALGKLLQKTQLAPSAKVKQASLRTSAVIKEFLKHKNIRVIMDFLEELQTRISASDIAAMAAQEGIETAIVGLRAAVSAKRGHEKEVVFSAMAAFVTKAAMLPLRNKHTTELGEEVRQYVIEAIQNPPRSGDILFRELVGLSETPQKVAINAGLSVAKAAIEASQKHSGRHSRRGGSSHSEGKF